MLFKKTLIKTRKLRYHLLSLSWQRSRLSLPNSTQLKLALSSSPTSHSILTEHAATPLSHQTHSLTQSYGGVSTLAGLVPFWEIPAETQFGVGFVVLIFKRHTDISKRSLQTTFQTLPLVWPHLIHHKGISLLKVIALQNKKRWLERACLYVCLRMLDFYLLVHFTFSRHCQGGKMV